MPVNKKTFPYLLLLPSLLLILLVGIYPLMYLIQNSLFSFTLIRQAEKVFVGLANYRDLLISQQFWSSLLITVIYVVSSTFITFVLGLGIALLLNQGTPLTRVFRSIFLMPMVATPVIVALTWRHIWDFRFGIMNLFLSKVGIKPLLWLADTKLALLSIIITDVWQWTPFVILVIEAGLVAIPEYLYEAAVVDGCNFWKRFWYMTVPHLRPVIGLTLAIRVMDLFRNADLVYVITSGGPGTSTEVLAFSVFKKAFVIFQIGDAAATAIILVILTTFIVSSLIKRWDIEF
ncbi:MAG: sugar ABC transporter permease [Candidatus Atribacteria bacterium]|nr:sugar ABC transporter permease [Candidatus Atribacteria bacterium]